MSLQDQGANFRRHPRQGESFPRKQARPHGGNQKSNIDGNKREELIAIEGVGLKQVEKG